MMDQKSQNWSFEVVTIPQQDDSLGLSTTTTKTTPVKVKIRMKKANKKGAPRHGVISMPKMTSTNESTEKIRVVHSDQTIMSFNMLMETGTKSKSYKQQNKFFHLFKSGKCLGTRDKDENDPPYVRATPAPSNEVTTERLLSEKNQSETKLSSKLRKEITKAPVFLGKCRRGGCLDPPFAEDKYEYRPSTQHKQDQKEKCRNIIPEETELNNFDIIAKISRSVTKIESQETDMSSTCMLYNAQSKSSLIHDKQSDSIITYPTEISSDDLGISGKSTIRKTSAATSKTSSEMTDTYFMPPKINYRKISDKNKDINKSNQLDEIKYIRKSKDNAISEYKEISLSSRDDNIVTGIPHVLGTTEPIIQPERKLSQFIESPESIAENTQTKGRPYSLRTNDANELNASEGTNFYSKGKSQMSQPLNSFLDLLQQPKLNTLNIISNTSQDEKVSDIDDNMFIPVAVNNSPTEYTGDGLKSKSITTFEKETNNFVKHAVSVNKIESSFPSKDLQTYVPLTEEISFKDSISESNVHERINKKSIECTDTNLQTTKYTIANSDILPILSNNVSSHIKIRELSALDSHGYVQPTSLTSDVTHKGDIVDQNFQKNINERESPISKLQPTDNNVSKYDNDDYKNNFIGKVNEVEDISQTVLISNLEESKETISKTALHNQNKYILQVNNSQSMDFNGNENVKDLNKSETLINAHTFCEAVNEIPKEITDINNDNVKSDEKSKLNKTVTSVNSTLNIENKTAILSSERLKIDNQENNNNIMITEDISSRTSEIKVNLISYNIHMPIENEIKHTKQIEGTTENVLADNIMIAEGSGTHTPEVITVTPTDDLIFYARVMPIGEEIQHTKGIEGTSEIKNDSIIEKDSTIKQEKNAEKEIISDISSDLSYNYNVPINAQITTSVENSTINTSETQKICVDRLIYENKSNSMSQNSEKDTPHKIYENNLLDDKSGDEKFNKLLALKLSSNGLLSNLNINKKEVSRIDSLNLPKINSENAVKYLDTLQFSNIKNDDARIEEFNSFQRNPNVPCNEKISSCSSENTKDNIQIRENSETKDNIPISLDVKKLSQASLQNNVMKSIIVDLAFQMYLNDANQAILKTFDASQKPNRMPYDNISGMKSVLNLSDNNKLSLAINSEIKVTIEINKTYDHIDNEGRSLKIKEISNDDSTQYSSYIDNKHVNVRNMQSLQKSLAVIYENNLIPVQKLIRNLIGEIDSISKYRSIAKKKSIVSKKIKISKPAYSPKRCGCLKNEYGLC